jgi:hypothetical protein
LQTRREEDVSAREVKKNVVVGRGDQDAGDAIDGANSETTAATRATSHR